MRVLASSWLAALVLSAAACGSGGSLPDEVARALDVRGESIANLTGGLETFDPVAVLEAVNRANRLGAPMRVVVVPPDQQLVSPGSVVDRYGGTVLSYRAGEFAFDAASADLASSQLELAMNAAAGQSGIEASAAAFVGVLERNGVQPASGSALTWLFGFFVALAALFLIWQLLRFVGVVGRRSPTAESDGRRQSSHPEPSADSESNYGQR